MDVSEVGLEGIVSNKHRIGDPKGAIVLAWLSDIEEAEAGFL
jgi:hypothetical protein